MTNHPPLDPPPLDPVTLTQDLVKCPSVTPAEGGAITLLDQILSAAGFETTRVDRGGIANLFARFGPKGHAKTFGFNGHTDVVPEGDAGAWTHPPFGGEIHDGVLYGRGACDMKSGVAAFVAAAVDHVAGRDPADMDGAITLTITGDEEAEADHGTLALLDYMAGAGEVMDVCLVGEPTCPNTMGEMMKIGRRGSLNAKISVTGTQGHAAYPHRAKNAVHALITLLSRLTTEAMDAGTEHFEPSTLVVASVDTGNPTSNVIPATCRALINIRFNDAHTGASVTAMLQAACDAVAAETGTAFSLAVKISGESFVTQTGTFSELVADAVESVTGRRPEYSTTGGTSDARFMKTICPVVEFGLVGQSMHKTDEHVAIDHITQLKDIYASVLRGYFA